MMESFRQFWYYELLLKGYVSYEMYEGRIMWTLFTLAITVFILIIVTPNFIKNPIINFFNRLKRLWDLSNKESEQNK